MYSSHASREGRFRRTPTNDPGECALDLTPYIKMLMPAGRTLMACDVHCGVRGAPSTMEYGRRRRKHARAGVDRPQCNTFYTSNHGMGSQGQASPLEPGLSPDSPVHRSARQEGSTLPEDVLVHLQCNHRVVQLLLVAPRRRKTAGSLRPC